jgi:hypothetical protein
LKARNLTEDQIHLPEATHTSKYFYPFCHRWLGFVLRCALGYRFVLRQMAFYKQLAQLDAHTSSNFLARRSFALQEFSRIT